MKKPKILRAGDTVALVSLSSGVAGKSNIQWRGAFDSKITYFI
ncbi:hypothetical protein [Candidatus Enterococcus lowellii]|nr:hypothetical protein [Enterococcus sp. DIV2402]